jgi:hypothetical protein
MGAARRAHRAAIAVLVCACASPTSPPAGRCLAAAGRAPRASPECIQDPEGERHAGRIASAIADALMGYHSHPGSAEFSVSFGADATVSSLCTDRVEGAEIARRVPRAFRRLEEMPAGPACFAGRRLDFAWESSDVTSEHVRQATRDCRRRIEGHRRRNLFCHETQRCSREEVVGRWDRGDQELRACVLEKVPLEMHLAGSAEAHHFVPEAGSVPDPELAVRALDVCEALADRDALVGCMREHGWEPRP